MDAKKKKKKDYWSLKCRKKKLGKVKRWKKM